MQNQEPKIMKWFRLGSRFFGSCSFRSIFFFFIFKLENNFDEFLHREVYTGNLSENEFIKKERFEKSMFKNVISFCFYSYFLHKFIFISSLHGPGKDSLALDGK